MNQFKKAKQLRNETGQPTESITDLKTAGVTQKEESTEPSITEQKEIQQNSNDKDNSAENKNNTLPENLELTSDAKETNIDMEVKTIVQTATETNIIEPIPSIIPPVNTATPSPVVLEPTVTEPETIVYEQPSPHTEAVAPEYPTPSYENVRDSVTPVTPPQKPNIYNTQNTISQTGSAPLPIISQPIMPSYTVQTEYNNIPQAVPAQPYIEPQSSQEVVAIKHDKSTKKSVPNIFTPKGEAKSMRKSLVLKPTSVKIAENYCEKNGGSFNELIQTLLDNFINEDGL